MFGFLGYGSFAIKNIGKMNNIRKYKCFIGFYFDKLKIHYFSSFLKKEYIRVLKNLYD
tara:strand:- start:889 stop:1062 length:174 start_codon:yes stop_codon:yes gene_type:complete